MSLIDTFIFKLYHGPIRRWYRKFQQWEYSKYEADHIFNIRVDDMKFKMTFTDYPLGPTIVERIEGRREPETTAIIKSLVKRNSNVLELGGCYGYFTIIFSKCVGLEGKVLSIEGTPNNFLILEENLRLNDIKNVDTCLTFLTSKDTRALFNTDDKGPYQAINRLEKPSDLNSNELVAIHTTKITALLEDMDFYPDYIFMDIEGFEVEVFDDLAKNYLMLCKPIIVFEIHSGTYKPGKDLDFIKSILHENNYHYRKIAQNLICIPN